MGASSDSDFFEYIYTHNRTQDTTGYFSCEPADAPDFWSAIKRLSQRPMDSFLHQYVLRHALEMNIDELAAAVSKDSHRLSDEKTREILAGLLSEIALLRNGTDAVPPHQENPDARQPPACNCGSRELKNNSIWSHAFRANIHAHRALPPDIWLENFPHEPESLDAADSEMAAWRGLLEEEWRKLSKNVHVQQETVPPAQTAAAALQALSRAGIIAGPEMRHEASLSPIALLREWNVEGGQLGGPMAHLMRGRATAFGRGLSLAQARASCLMEIVERSSAYVSFAGNPASVTKRLKTVPVLRASRTELESAGHRTIFPFPGQKYDVDRLHLHWVAGENADGEEILTPCQAVFLFCNLDEPDLLDPPGSTGLAAGNSLEEARLGALVEILEREAHAGMPFRMEDCFIPASRDERIQGLLRDYRFKGIHVQFQDISGETGLPAYRCFVAGRDGKIAQATGAGLNGMRAALAAMTETPWPYSWASPAASPSAPAPAALPVRYLEDLPDYSLPDTGASLFMLETVLKKMGRMPVYVDITRQDLAFPVVRAFLPHMEVNVDFDGFLPPGPRLLARARRFF